MCLRKQIKQEYRYDYQSGRWNVSPDIWNTTEKRHDIEDAAPLELAERKRHRQPCIHEYPQ